MEKEKATLIKVITSKRYGQNTKNDFPFDSVLLFYRDENGEKKTEFVSRAVSPYYLLKDKTSEEAATEPLFIKKEKVELKTPYSDSLFRDIAIQTGTIQFYDSLITSGAKSSEFKNLFQHPWVYEADMDLSDRYIRNFHDTHETNPAYKLYKCYFDIEVDLMGFNGFPDEELAPCPINIITLVDEKFMTVHTFVVRNPRNPKIAELERDVEKFKKYMKEKVEAEDQIIFNEFYINFYDSELETIKAFFNCVHEKNPDYMIAWNEAFDVITLQNRLRKLCNDESLKEQKKDKRMDAENMMLNIMCDSQYFLQKDNMNGSDIYLTPFARYSAQKDKSFVDRMDSFNILDGIVWLDSLLLYANLRKSSGQRESYTLDFISNLELGKEKLPFGPGETIQNLPYRNFKKFSEYNIRDVILLLLLERKNLDVNSVQSISEITSTRVEKVLKKTISLKNFVNKFANENGYIMSDNKNARYGNEARRKEFENTFLSRKRLIEPNTHYRNLFEKRDNFGAYVGDPNLNTNKNGFEIVPGKKNPFMLSLVFDMDFSALYPSIIQAFNLSPMSQVGKFFLIDPETKNKLIEECGFSSLFVESTNGKKETNIPDEDTDLGPSLAKFIISMDYSKLGKIFFNLPSTEEMINEIKQRKSKQ